MDWTLANTLRRHIAERPGAPMIVYGDRTVSWAEMHERSSRVAQGLIAEGVTAGDRIAFLEKNGLEYEALISVARARIQIVRSAMGVA